MGSGGVRSARSVASQKKLEVVRGGGESGGLEDADTRKK